MTSLCVDEGHPATDWSPLDERSFHRLMAHVPAPVAVVTGCAASGEPLGFTVSSFISVSLNPPLVLFCAARTSTTWPRMAQAGRFVVNLLPAEEAGLAQRFARPVDRFLGIAWECSPGGTPVLLAAYATLECSVMQTHPAADHLIVVGEVVDGRLATDSLPLVRYRSTYSTVRTDGPRRSGPWRDLHPARKSG
jgi:3-hydroxy-9,10-secoandrosta-1,3,5(10)-triene-9,17-dione monooxygenase reductase component